MSDYRKYINALRKCAKEHKDDTTSTGHIIVSDLCSDTANLLEALEKEPKIGHWIVSMDCEGKTRQCTCDLCDYETGKNTWKNPNFCEDCGAKMEGEENEDRSDEA